MVVRVEVGDIELAIVQYHQDALGVGELAQETSVLFVVDAIDIGVKPYFPASQGRVAVAFQPDAVDVLFRQQVALGGSALDEHLGEIFLHEDVLFLAFGVWLQRHLDDFRLSVGIGREVNHPGTGFPLRQVIHLVAGHGGDIETLDIVWPCLAVPVDAVVDGAGVVLLKHLHVQDILADEDFLGHFCHLELSVSIEDDDIVQVGAVAH